MIETKKDLYIIEAVTNMHVGSGEDDFGVIDNKVQRDVLTEYPVINSSSLKGALKTFFRSKDKNSNDDKDSELLKYIFGYEKEEDEKFKDTRGNYKFFDAHLLAIPVRSNFKPYYMAICPQIIKDFQEYLDIFAKDKGKELKKDLNKLDNLCGDRDIVVFENSDKKIFIEDFYNVVSKKEEDLDKIKDIIGEDIALFSDSKFKEIVKELPVRARNKLENGESKNLWYEEMVPRKTKFYFGVDKGVKNEEIPNINKSKNDINEEFNKILNSDMIQIGGNASIGYGYCNLRKFGDSNG